MGVSTLPVPSLSDHAVTRYIQRVLGISLGAGPDTFHAGEVMAAHLDAAGLTRDAVVAAVLTPAVREAIAQGTVFISAPIGNIRVDRSGRVITIGRSRVEPSYSE